MFDAGPWYGCMVPAKTPPEIVRTLALELGKVLTDPAFREQAIEAKTMDPAPVGPEALAAMLKANSDKYARYLQGVNV